MNVRRQLLHALAAVAGASLVTLAAVWLMTVLNRLPSAQADDAQPIRCTLIRRSLPPPASIPQQPSEPQPSHSEPERMSIDLNAPPLQLPAVEPIELVAALPSPRADAIQVVVRKPVIAPAAQSASTSPPRSTAAQEASARKTNDAPSKSIPSADEVDQPPREPAGNAKPAYPAREQQLGIEGTVVVKLLIDESGRVEEVKFTSGGEAFRRAVLAVARTWRFEPARHQGRPIKVWGVKEVSFTHPRNRR